MARVFVKKIVLMTAFIATCGAAPVMTRDGFYDVEIGTSADQMVEKYGKPYSVKENSDGSEDYRYIEKIPAGDQTVEENTYIFVVKDGKIVSKRYNQELPPAYDEIYDDDPNDVPN